MPNHSATPDASFDSLVRIVDLLRKECPWDKEQTPASIKDLMIEEVYEAVDAIDRCDQAELKKELGDLLLHVVFQARMAAEPAHFTIEDVILGLQEKLIRRHPHVFSTKTVGSTKEVLQNWEQIKMKEGGGRKSVLEGVPRPLPALLRAERMQEKVAAVGFDWPHVNGAWEKVNEEIQELRAALDRGTDAEKQKEFGDVLFSLVNIGRFYNLHAEDALRGTNDKFQRRFVFVEEQLALRGKTPKTSTLEEMDALWTESKTIHP